MVAAYRQTHSQVDWLGLRVGSCLVLSLLYSLYEQNRVWPNHDDGIVTKNTQLNKIHKTTPHGISSNTGWIRVSIRKKKIKL